MANPRLSIATQTGDDDKPSAISATEPAPPSKVAKKMFVGNQTAVPIPNHNDVVSPEHNTTSDEPLKDKPRKDKPEPENGENKPNEKTQKNKHERLDSPPEEKSEETKKDKPMERNETPKDRPEDKDITQKGKSSKKDDTPSIKRKKPVMINKSNQNNKESLKEAASKAIVTFPKTPLGHSTKNEDRTQKNGKTDESSKDKSKLKQNLPDIIITPASEDSDHSKTNGSPKSKGNIKAPKDTPKMNKQMNKKNEKKVIGPPMGKVHKFDEIIEEDMTIENGRVDYEKGITGANGIFFTYSLAHKLLVAMTVLMFGLTVFFVFSAFSFGKAAGFYRSNSDDLYEEKSFGVSLTTGYYIVLAIVFVWQLIWLLYGVAATCRKRLYPEVIPMAVYMIYVVQLLCHVIAVLLWDLQYLEAATALYSLVTALLFACIGVCIYKFGKAAFMVKVFGKKIDIWLVRLFLHNGLAIYAAWMSIVAYVSLGVSLVYAANLSKSTTSAIVLGVFSFEILFIFVVETFLIENMLRYIFAHYISFLAASICIFRYSRGTENGTKLITDWSLALMIILALLFIFKLARSYFLHRRRKKPKPETTQSPSRDIQRTTL